MPDRNELEILKAEVAAYRSQIATAVRFACWNTNYKALPEEIEDCTEDITQLLLEDDCRKYRTFRAEKAAFETWLQTVAINFVRRRAKKKRPTIALADELLNTLTYAPPQDKELLGKERRALLDEAIDTLSLHDQRIARLKLLEVPDEEIAQELNIKPASVGREWRVIQTKLKQIVTGGE